MKKSRFTEAQIVAVLHERDPGTKMAVLVRRHRANAVSLEEEVRRPADLGSETAEGARERESAAQAARG
jgi:hypothetical protein